ncbi:Protein trichome birefringence-like 19 [Stylosanthes scabra]|uniref:Protein trichome birefringence-like 19 n=1 Tax=Stylosanthes scabra TaxID=79078 RepID=A0ABU6XW39_9FABA|nr:Protein trichome birefringence-like 19 [Stylosanthes scabra]
MKSQVTELLSWNNASKQLITPKPTLLISLLTLTILITITSLSPISYPLFDYSSLPLNIHNNNKPYDAHLNDDDNKCDISRGEWVPNPEAPYYTNETCREIHEHQNCMKYGRPDSEFMKWRWKPYECELPVFNPWQFLEIVKGKSMAIVGDSIGRNQMQSMICLLSRVELPIDVSEKADFNFMRWRYPTYNFTLATFWSPYLIKAQERDSNGPTNTGLFNLYLDEFDENWSTQIQDFDFVILNAGQWFFRPMVFYEKQQLVGCHYCLLENVTDLNGTYGYRMALRTSFRSINGLENFKGVTFLRTFSPSHFENGLWNQGGNCLRRRPFRSNETQLEGTFLELYRIQLEELKIAEEEGRDKGLRFRLFDTTQAMLLRPDGHPSRYGHWPNENVTLYNDCVHWCLPGPIDTWSDFLLHLLKMEGVRSDEQSRLHLKSD